MTLLTVSIEGKMPRLKDKLKRKDKGPEDQIWKGGELLRVYYWDLRITGG